MRQSFKLGSGQKPESKRLPVESSGFSLPQFVHDYLSSGAAEGTRNETIFKVAQQFFWCKLTESDCLSRVLPRALAQGGPGVENEVKKAVARGYKSAPRDPLDPLIDDSRPVVRATPSLSGWTATMAGLRAAFGERELVGICGPGPDGVPSSARVRSVARWEGKASSVRACEQGAWVCINPLKELGTGATIENVAAFRHVLVEYDDSSLSLAEQEANIRKAGFPISALLTSGGRSVHAWVRVDAPDLDEWNKRREIAWEAVPGCDEKVKGPARLSRLPGFMRGDREQKLLAVNVGAKSWAAWVGKEDEGDAENWNPKSWGVTDLIDNGPEAPPEIIKGVLRKGCVMQISSGPKMKKSYTLLDLAISVEAGIPWMGLETVAGPVFIADAENQAALIRQRLPHVMRGRGVKATAEMNRRFRIAPMRGHLRGKTLAQIVAGVVRSIREMPEPPVLAILEPLYLLLRGAKEKEAEEVTAALEELDEVCREVGCSVVFVHHFSKGGQGGKASMDRASGSGALSRFPDVIFTLNPPDEPKKGEAKPDWDAMVSMDLRWFPKRPDFPVYWRDSHYTQDKNERGAVAPMERVERWIAVRDMPVKHRGPSPEKCEVSEWMARFCRCSLLEAFNAFTTLSGDGLGFVKDLGEGFFEGVNEKTPPPFEGEVDEDQPF